jgi:malonate-semialdehyde dehydrogenase (acetylating)/methylmalonate-semialdehyde dehydrogenase
MGSIVEHFINGKKVSGSDDRYQDVFNPATGEVSGQVALASSATVESAISAAEAAFPAWRDTTPAKRAQVMFRYKQLLEEHAEEIDLLLTLEHGKVLADSHGEFLRAVEVVEYMCGTPELLKGEHSKNVGPAIDSWSERQALGVCASITPFNFPVMVPMWSLAPAIACGNTVVLKPSEKDPSSTFRAIELLKEAGLPDGVVNIVNGDKEAVDTLLTDPRIQAVSFVGSTPIAEYIYATGSANGKRVQALGGAKNHAIIMPDADLDNAVSAMMGAAFGSCGERCMAVPVAVTVGEETGDAFVEKIKLEIAGMKVGPGTDPDSEMGPLVTKQHFDKVTSYVDLGVEEGAELIVDGRGLTVEGNENGYFLGGCLFDRVTPEMKVYQDEIFGPVLVVVRVNTQQEAMDLIDAHEFGNGTCIFTRDGEAARYFTDNIKVGMVGVNVPLPVPVAYQSFGGWKRSIFGDHGMYGRDGINFFTRRKTITQRWPSAGVREGAVYTFPTNK